MGWFDKLKEKLQPQVVCTPVYANKPQSSTLNGDLYANCTFEEALRMCNGETCGVRDKGSMIMYRLADKPTEDPRAIMWVAQSKERKGEFKRAASWYKKAYEAGVKEAQVEYERCNAPHYYNPQIYNPYNIEEYSYANGQRGCATFYFEHVEETQQEQREDFAKAIAKLETELSQDEVFECFKTIHLVASAKGCAVPEAQMWMGNYCETVREDLKEAAQWFKRASDNKSADGARCYADMLMSGRGVAKDLEEALKYYHLAAERGQAEAQFVIGQYHQNSGNTAEALKYYNLSAENGFAPAREQITRIEKGKADNAGFMYEEKLQQIFSDILSKYELDSDGVLEYYADIYQPDDFCKKVYDYCNQQYAESGKENIAYEYCMTAFYGNICAIALWNQNNALFENNASIWNVLAEQIDVEFTDSNAERLLETKSGEEKAERIYSLVCEYIKIAIAVMRLNDMNEDACLRAIKFAYQLGMLVAKKEMDIDSPNYVREYIVQGNEGSKNAIKNVAEFYSECIQRFHDKALKSGFAKRGLIFIPELMPMGEKAILAYLKDAFFEQAFGKNPAHYYYVIMSLALQTGICFGEKWHKDFDGLNNGYVEKIIMEGPVEEAESILAKSLGIVGSEQQHELYHKIYETWTQCHEPYWSLESPREYTFKAMIAAYQLGISMILEKYGF